MECYKLIMIVGYSFFIIGLLFALGDGCMLLHFLETGLSHIEVPGETALCIYISGCVNNCPDCHYPELKRNDFGDVLHDFYDQILDAHERGLKSCLYSGRDIQIELWMKEFDYIKLGSYKAEKGPLYCRNTNQKMYQKIAGAFCDITDVFWES